MAEILQSMAEETVSEQLDRCIQSLLEMHIGLCWQIHHAKNGPDACSPHEQHHNLECGHGFVEVLLRTISIRLQQWGRLTVEQAKCIKQQLFYIDTFKQSVHVLFAHVYERHPGSEKTAGKIQPVMQEEAVKWLSEIQQFLLREAIALRATLPAKPLGRDTNISSSMTSLEIV